MQLCRPLRVVLLATPLLLGAPAALAQEAPAPRGPLVHTYSIVARDPATGELGVGVASRFFAVGAVVPWARAGVGAVGGG